MKTFLKNFLTITSLLITNTLLFGDYYPGPTLTIQESSDHKNLIVKVKFYKETFYPRESYPDPKHISVALKVMKDNTKPLADIALRGEGARKDEKGNDRVEYFSVHGTYPNSEWRIPYSKWLKSPDDATHAGEGGHTMEVTLTVPIEGAGKYTAHLNIDATYDPEIEEIYIPKSITVSVQQNKQPKIYWSQIEGTTLGSTQTIYTKTGQPIKSFEIPWSNWKSFKLRAYAEDPDDGENINEYKLGTITFDGHINPTQSIGINGNATAWTSTPVINNPTINTTYTLQTTATDKSGTSNAESNVSQVYIKFVKDSGGSGVTLKSDKTKIQAHGDVVTFTASGGIGNGDYEYQIEKVSGASDLLNTLTKSTSGTNNNIYTVKSGSKTGKFKVRARRGEGDTTTASAWTSYITVEVTGIATTITWSGLSHTYDGNKKSATATVNPTAALNSDANTKNKGPTAGKYEVSVTLKPGYTASNTTNTLNIAKATQTVTISPDTAKFSAGTSQTFTASGGAGNGTWVWSGSNTDINLSATTNTAKTKFQNVGTRTVSVYKNGDDNYNKSNTAIATITINKIPVDFSFGKLNYTYDGNAKTATVTASATVPKGMKITYDTDLTKGPNAGDHKVTATATGNFSGSGSAILKIAKADQEKPTLTIDPAQILPGGIATLRPAIAKPTGSAWEYTGITSTISGYTPSIQGNMALNTHTITDTNPQTITLSVRRAGNTNYNPSSESDAKTLVVGKYTQKGEITATKNRIYTKKSSTDTSENTEANVTVSTNKTPTTNEITWAKSGGGTITENKTNEKEATIWSLTKTTINPITCQITGSETFNEATFYYNTPIEIVDRYNNPILEWWGEHTNGTIPYTGKLKTTEGYTFSPNNKITIQTTAQDDDGIFDCIGISHEIAGTTKNAALKDIQNKQIPTFQTTYTFPTNDFTQERKATSLVKQSQLEVNTNELQFEMANRLPKQGTIVATSPIYLGQSTKIKSDIADNDGNLFKHHIHTRSPTNAKFNIQTYTLTPPIETNTQNFTHTPTLSGNWLYQNFAEDSHGKITYSNGAIVTVTPRAAPLIKLTWKSPRTNKEYTAINDTTPVTKSVDRDQINPNHETEDHPDYIVNGDTIPINVTLTSQHGNAIYLKLKVYNSKNETVKEITNPITEDITAKPTTSNINYDIAIPNQSEATGEWKIEIETESKWEHPNEKKVVVTYKMLVSQAQAGITVNPNPINFGSVHVNTISGTPTTSTKALTITNPGLGDLIISNLEISNPEFTTAQIPKFTLQGKASTGGVTVSHKFNITFNADNPKNRTGTLKIHHNAPNSPTVVNFTGIGLAPEMTVKWDDKPTNIINQQ